MGTADRERILGCRDDGTLSSWLGRVLSVSAIGELFAD
jgi:hypothetical protein